MKLTPEDLPTFIDPRLTLVVAVAANGVIGRDGGLPWRLPDDLKHFRRLTLGKTVLMGRKTYASLGKPLQGRENWVLSSAPGIDIDGVRGFASLDSALKAFSGQELMVIGGAHVYRETLPMAAKIELTQIDESIDGDTFFPEFDRNAWTEMAREHHAADDRHGYAFSYITLVRDPDLKASSA